MGRAPFPSCWDAGAGVWASTPGHLQPETCVPGQALATRARVTEDTGRAPGAAASHRRRSQGAGHGRGAALRRDTELFRTQPLGTGPARERSEACGTGWATPCPGGKE